MLGRGRRAVWRGSWTAAGTLAVVVAASAGAGCGGCPPHPNITFDRVNTASIMLEGYTRAAGAGPETFVSDDVGFTEFMGLLWFKNGPDYYGMSPVVVPDDLQLVMFEPAHSTTNPTPPSGDSVGFSMLIHGVVGGPTEIDLDDTRAQLSAGLGAGSYYGDGVLQHDLSGHLSFTRFASMQCETVTTCALSVDGTFSFVSTGSGGQRTTVTNGTIRANDTVFEDDTCGPTYPNGND